MNRNFNQTISTGTNKNNNSVNYEEDPVVKVFGFNLKLSTFDYALKLIEVIFLGYYLYTFYVNYRTGNLSQYKIFINLVIIFQSLYSLFYSTRTTQALNYNFY